MKNKIAKYEEGPIAKRLFAAIMDAVVFIFVFFGLALWVFTPIANAGLGYQDANDLGRRYHLASHLYLAQKTNDDGIIVNVAVKDSTGNMLDYSEATLYNYVTDDVSFYIDHLYYYYHNYKTGTDIELPAPTLTKTFDAFEDHFVAPDYNTPINGVLPVNLYTDTWFAEIILNIGNDNSLFKIDSSKETFVESIVLVDEAKKDDAITYLRNEAYEAASELYYSPYFQEIEKTVEAIQIFIFFPSFALSFFIFYLLVPLLMKDGETFGKKVCHLAVISIDGYKAKKRQIVFRQVLLFLAISFCAVVVGIGVTSFAIMALGVFILFILTLISKQKRSPHDYAAFTIVVDSIHSTWFKDQADEERHQKEIEDNMAKYRKYVPENKNLIQVGSEIVDENLKKEIEEDKKKSESEK